MTDTMRIVDEVIALQKRWALVSKNSPGSREEAAIRSLARRKYEEMKVMVNAEDRANNRPLTFLIQGGTVNE